MKKDCSIDSPFVNVNLLLIICFPVVGKFTEKGELIGIAFDGNIEAMAGDVIFDSKLQRTINVDIRYVLWIIDKYAGAKNIIDELTLVK